MVNLNLFYIRNILAVKITEEIIKKNDIKNAVGVIVRNEQSNYFDKVSSVMSKDLWDDIKESKIDSTIRMNLRNRRTFFNLLDEQSKLISDLLKGVSSVYLSNINSIEEKLIYHIAQVDSIEINFYEEGLNLYYDSSDFNKRTVHEKLKKPFKLIWAGRYRHVLWGKSKFLADTIYCVFPEKYKFNNFKKIQRVRPKFSVEAENEQIKKFKTKNLFLSRPLSEDNILDLRDEMKLIETVLKKCNGKLVIKFHPRESDEKKQTILSKYKIDEIPEFLRGFAAEEIVLNGKVERLIGYETATLAYVSELSNVETYCLLKDLRDKSDYFYMISNLFEYEFDKIRFL